MKKALVVVDMNNDFVHDQGTLTCGEVGQKIVPYIIQLINDFQKDRHFVVFANDHHQPDDEEFNVWPKHCVEGTWGAELYGELKNLSAHVPLLKKTKYDAFYQTELEELLRQQAVQEVHVVGVCTSICVYATLQGAYFRGFRTVTHREGVGDFNPKAHDFALEHVSNVFKTEVY